MPGVKGQRSGGHNAKTVAQHQLAGTMQKVRHAGIRNPTPSAGVPKSPKKLTGDAKDEWDRMLAELEDMGTLAKTDRAALYQYCQLFGETEAIAQTQQETAATIDLLEENLHGPAEERENLLGVVQEITKLRQLEARYTNQIRQGRMGLRTYLVEFGMTPASRGRVRLPSAPSDRDEWDDLDGTLQ